MKKGRNEWRRYVKAKKRVGEDDGESALESGREDEGRSEKSRGSEG